MRRIERFEYRVLDDNRAQPRRRTGRAPYQPRTRSRSREVLIPNTSTVL